MTAPAITPALHTPRGPLMDHGLVAKTIGTTFTGLGARNILGGPDFMRFRVKFDGVEQRHTAVVKATDADAYTVEIGAVDRETSIPTYTPRAQREAVTLADLADALCDLHDELSGAKTL